MKTKLNPNAIEVTPVAIETVEPAFPAHYKPEMYDDVSRDVETPVLGMVNNVGPLATKFKNKGGNFVLGDILLGETVSVIPIDIAKFYRETWRNGKEIKYGSPEDKTRRTFSSAHEASTHGYVVDFDGTQLNRIEECGRIGYLVIKPQGDTSGEFILRAGSLELASAKCMYQRGGFREVWRRIFDHSHKLCISKGIELKGLDHRTVFNKARAWTHQWTLSAASVEGSQNSWYEARIAKGAALPEDVVTWITDKYGL